MNPNYSYGGLSKLKALHNGFKPEYDEEDETLPVLTGTAQKPPEQVEPERIPSVYDNPNPKSFTQQTNEHLMNTVGKGLSALKDYLVDSFAPEQKNPNNYNGPYLHAGMNKESPEAAESAPISSVRNFRKQATEKNEPTRLMNPKQEEAKPASPVKAMTPQQIKFFDNSPAARKSMSPQEKQSYEQSKLGEAKSVDEKIAELNKTKEATLVPGASEEMLKDPMAMAEFGKITGIDYTPQLQEALKPYEALAKHSQDILDEEEAEIRARFDSGSMTTQDKVLLGLAIAVPSILAGIFGGGEAAASAFAGGVKGAGEGLESRNKQSLEDRKRLAEIGKEKLVVEGSTADLKKKLKELIPGDPIRDALEDMQTVYIPETGKTGVITGNEALAYDMKNFSKGNIKHDRDVMNKKTEDAQDRMEAINSLNEVTEDIDKIYDQLIKQGNSSFYPSVAGKIIPGGENWFSAEVTDPVTGQKSKASALLNLLIEKALDKYRVSQVGKAGAITERMRTHFDKLLGNPFTLDQGLSIKDAKNSANTLQTVLAKEFIDGMKIQGFLPEPLEKKFLLPIEEKKRGVARDLAKQKLQKEAEAEIKKMTPDQLNQARKGYVVETSNG